MTDKIIKFFKGVGAIWTVMAALCASLVWASEAYHEKFLLVAKYEQRQKTVVVKQINREIAEIETRLLYINDAQKKAMYKAIIINKQTQIKNIREQ